MSLIFTQSSDTEDFLCQYFTDITRKNYTNRYSQFR